MLKVHTAFRNKQEWNSSGLKFTTESDKALQLYDSVLTQYVGWYEEDEGLEETLTRLKNEDKSFVLGAAMSPLLELIATGTSLRTNKDLEASVTEVYRLADESEHLTLRESKHIEALKQLADGCMKEACEIWEDILVDDPYDLLAVKLAHDCYFYLGEQRLMRDSLARVIPRWTPSTPLYGFLLGMWAFGLCETGDYTAAEEKAKQALSINRSDSWATHALAHVYEMTGRFEEGIQFMLDTIEDWKHCSMLACHNFWHFAVYYIEKGDFKEALQIVDTQVILKMNTSNAMLDIVDACSILLRLEMQGVDIGNRWSLIQAVVAAHSSDHVMMFNDAHVMMCLSGQTDTEEADQMLNSLHKYISDESLTHHTNHKISSQLGPRLLRAIIAFRCRDFTECTRLLLEIRYQIITIGGSNAQRDVFDQLLITSALESPRYENIARVLILERKALKHNSPLTDRLQLRFVNKFNNPLLN